MWRAKEEDVRSLWRLVNKCSGLFEGEIRSCLVMSYLCSKLAQVKQGSMRKASRVFVWVGHDVFGSV